MELTLVEIAIGAVLTASGIAASWFVGNGRLKVERRKLQLAEKEMDFQADALDFVSFLGDWQHTSDELSSIIEETEIDRILILRAWNGTLSPKWTTARFQMRELGQKIRQYIHFELDQDYVDRLREISGCGELYFVVDEINQNDSRIKQVYQAEGVLASYWAHIETLSRIDSPECKAVSYISFSTTTHKEISEKTRTRCMIMAGRLKGIASNFRSEKPIP